jgi:hypothetical protein
MEAISAHACLQSKESSQCPRNPPDGKSLKLDRMNADLAKAGAYNTMVQKQVTWLADIGNKAAHGDMAGFKDTDASDMIAQTERFVRDYT